MKVCRRATFNSAHRLYRKDWTDDKNKTVFGKCSNENFHGHNYTLEVWISGNVNQETGYLIDLKIVKDLIKEEISDRFDHKNLNLDC
ncbi:MAG: 6-pyruvoyl trahydropterin synthase family protein, partial [Crocinitomicaceae bacterium]